MRLENFATVVLVTLVVGLVFYAGYGWRIIVERRLHNMPWLRRSARKAALAAARSTTQPIVFRQPFLQAEPLERQMLRAASAEAESNDAVVTVDSAAAQIAAPRYRGRRRRKSQRKKLVPAEIKTVN